MTTIRSVLLSFASTVGLALTYLAAGASFDRIRFGNPIDGWPLIGLLAGPVLAGLASWLLMVRWPGQLATLEMGKRDQILRAVLATTGARRSAQWTGKTVSTATDGVERFANYQVTFVGPMIAAMTSPVLVIAIIGFVIDWTSALWLLAAVPVIPLVIGGFQGAFRRVSTKYRAAARRLAGKYLDSIQGLMTLRSLSAGRRAGDQLAHEAENVRRHVMRLLAGNQLVLFVSDAAFSLGMITVAVCLAISRGAHGHITPGAAVALVLLSTLLLEPLDRIGQFFYIGMGGMAAKREIKAFVDDSPAGPVNAGRPGHHVAADPAPPAGPRDGPVIELKGVRAGYESDSDSSDGRRYTEVLRGIDLRIGQGEHVAIVGPSGGGKSTLLAVIQGIVTPTAGSVLVAGTALDEAYEGWPAQQCAVVAQTTYLFTGSLAHNLRIAAPAASDDDLRAALEAANLGELTGLPEGLETQVGERGLSLSGGQAQRVAIARAILKDAPILLLDEPTSHVDLASERSILDALARLGAGRTVISVTHRARTARAADRLLELRDGRLLPISASTYGQCGTEAAK
ncbi:ABC transporter ATP-binding protein/permease [Rarobacter faecitabidus]|uniref:ABC transporter ATP-binding protein/permease n=1 Tax=Rarobacter faecitabidus TaxID=13243 RepID=UPI001151066D|nr:ATP-binding cassette domain-containing protein [Rarobacter faecitabidus]